MALDAIYNTLNESAKAENAALKKSKVDSSLLDAYSSIRLSSNPVSKLSMPITTWS